MEKNYKVTVRYDGSKYDGWQKQGNTAATVQGKLEAALEKMTGKETPVFGAGRTDAGVHALAQLANFHVDTGMTGEEILEYLNRYLPEDIAITGISQVPERFHSRFWAVEKTYLYRIETAPKKDVFQRKYVYGLGKTPDLELMRRAAVFLTGKRDFKSFSSNRNVKKSTVRTLEKIDLSIDGTILNIRYTGDGFLYNMVRILTGTLIEVGLGKRKPEEMEGILRAKNRQAAGFTAPPEGLFLETVSCKTEE